jgi:hypothetical protein
MTVPSPSSWRVVDGPESSFFVLLSRLEDALASVADGVLNRRGRITAAGCGIPRGSPNGLAGSAVAAGAATGLFRSGCEESSPRSSVAMSPVNPWFVDDVFDCAELDFAEFEPAEAGVIRIACGVAEEAEMAGVDTP